jgi:hypothetical protein
MRRMRGVAGLLTSRPLPAGEDLADVPQIGDRVLMLDRAFGISSKRVGHLYHQVAKLQERHAYQFV